MIEIYNEQVRDLLNKESMKVKGGLKVRQSPTLGFYGNTLSPAIKNRKNSTYSIRNMVRVDRLYVLYYK